MFSLKDMPTSVTQLFSAYASMSAFVMLVRSMVNEFIPHQLRSYILSFLKKIFTTPTSELTLIIDEDCGFTGNLIYEAAMIYLQTKISPSTECLKVSKRSRQKNVTIEIVKGEEIIDSYENIELKWKFTVEGQKNGHNENKFYTLSFEKKFKEKVLESYLPYVLSSGKAIKEKEKAVKLYGRNCVNNEVGGRLVGGRIGEWGCINFDHPVTFDKLAMDPLLKQTIKDDLDRFVSRKEFYKKVGKAWKRGYLLYGPPGTGKSSLIAAMANHLKFDIYDLNLASIHSDSELKRIMLSTCNRSILVIEDIDCGGQLQDRNIGTKQSSSDSKITLSGLLNSIDGLWSSCGDERIIVFTTNYKDRLDPALLRPGRMDMHFHMSYCTTHSFKILASLYLGIDGYHHPLFEEIEGLIESMEVTPAEIAEELMKSDDADTAFGGLVKFLKQKSLKGVESKA